MAIFQIGKTWYVDYYTGKGKSRKRIREAVGPRKTDAIARLGKIQAAKRENRLFDVKKEYTDTFDDLRERYTEAYKEQKYFQSAKKYFMPILQEFFSERLLSEITSYDIENFRNVRKATPVKGAIEKVPEGRKVRNKSPKLKRERSDADVNRILATLRHMFSKAVEWDMMGQSPFSNTKNLFYKENNMRLEFLTGTEEERLLFYCKDHLKPIVITALNTGMRRGEILTLKWSQIRNGFIYLRKTKTNEARQIPTNETLKDLFQSLPRHINSDYVFCNKDGKPYKDIKKSFKTALKKADIEDFRFHDLRHSFASKLVSKGAPLKAIQELLGHKNIKMTMRYAHLADDFKKDAVKLLDEDLKVESSHIKSKKR